MNKQEQITQYRLKPFEVGDKIIAKIPYTKNITRKVGKKYVSDIQEGIDTIQGEVISIENNVVKFINTNSTSYNCKYENQGNNKIFTVNMENIEYNIDHIGADSFLNYDWNSRITYSQSDLRSKLYKLELTNEDNSSEEYNERLEWNPFITRNGEDIYYQRDFCWSLNEKQLLIESIYNSIDIGKFIIRIRPYEWCEKRFKEGKPNCSRDIVDGKQRLNTIVEFINNKFTDLQGNYFDDFSNEAKRKFWKFSRFTFGEIGENATDEEVLKIFLNINFAGVLMSKEHIEFVKQITTK